MRVYHDTEWGVPVHDDRAMFEHLSLECFQCGLSWTLMLKKRESFRACLDGQMGGVIKTYREWKLSGNDEWLSALWPKVKLRR